MNAKYAFFIDTYFLELLTFSTALFYLTKEKRFMIMQELENVLYPIVVKINEYLSSYILIVLLIAVGLWYSVKTRFVQIRYFKDGMKKVFGNISLRGGKQQQGMSSFQALATAIAAQVGTGNIIGASGAILTGGPGAIFWMWVIAFFGMATIYAEATLAIKTRKVDKNGNILGGPVYYITEAFKGNFGKFLAGFFAVAIILALGFMGCMVQSNSIGSVFETAFGVPAWVIGIVLVVICAIIFLGGVQRLASVCEKIVPIMAALFLACAAIILICRMKYIPATFGMIFRYAFKPQAIIGGAFGTVMGEGFDAAFVAICLFFFAFSTILSWNMFAKINVIYLFGKKNDKVCTTVYTIIALVFIFVGTLMSNDLVWELTDAFNYLMVIPNAMALFAMTKVVLSSLQEKDKK